MDGADPQARRGPAAPSSVTAAKRGGEPGDMAAKRGGEPGDTSAGSGAGMSAIITRLDQLYHTQLAAKDDQIAAREGQFAAKDALIAELRQRLERAEQALAVAGRAEATDVPLDGDALRTSTVHALIAKLDQLYAEQIAAKDDQIAAKDELIAELRRRAEYAERQAGLVWEHGASTALSTARRPPTTQERTVDVERAGAPAAVGVRAPAAPEVAVPTGRLARAWRRWALIVPAVAIILAGVILSRVFAPPPATHVGAPRPAFTRFTPIAGVPLPAISVLAPAVGLAGPHEAVQLLGGQIAVADTGNHRLVLLDHAGHLVASVHAGRLRQPVALVAEPDALYVLDAARGTIERYTTVGSYIGEVIHDPALVGARGMAMGQGDVLYVANPRTNAIVVLSAQGKILYRITSPRGGGQGQLDEPADVAVGQGGTLYVADSANNRIEALSPSGTFVAQWPAPPSTPQQALHLLPLSDGRLLATDPAGGLLVYAPDSALPVFWRPLALSASRPRTVGPSGISLFGSSALLVTDGRGNRMLVVARPQ